MSLLASALTTVAAVREIVGTAPDTATIERAIQAVSNSFAKECGRVFEFGASIVEFHKGHGCEDLYLRRRGVTAVANVYISDTLQTVATLDATVTPGNLSYETVYRTTENDEKGILWRAGRWPLAAGTWGDLTGQPNISPSARGTNIRVVYSGGYDTALSADGATLPADLEQACIAEVSYRLSKPTGGLVAERTPGGWSQQWGKPTAGGAGFLEGVDSVLSSYRLDWL